MDEQNPLQISVPVKTPTTIAKNPNRSGRPKTKNLIKFGPQPKSIVSQMLSELKARKVIGDVNKIEIICLDELPGDSLEAEKCEEYICSTCAHSSNSKEEHEEHLNIHKRFVCDSPNCNYACKYFSNLVKHKIVHRNEKPYLCDKCSFRSNYINSLKTHKRLHTKKRPHHCKHCSYKCNSSSNLKKHCRHRHPDS